MNRRRLFAGIPALAIIPFLTETIVPQKHARPWIVNTGNGLRLGTGTSRKTPDGIVHYTEVPPMWNRADPEWRENRLFGYYMDYRGTEIGRIVSVKETVFQVNPEKTRASAREVLEYERQRRMFDRDQKLAGLA